MNDSAPIRDLNESAKRLYRFRVPLALALFVNCLLVARIPLAEVNKSNEGPAVRDEGAHLNVAPQQIALSSKPTTTPDSTTTPQPVTEASEPDENRTANTPVPNAKLEPRVNPVELAFRFAASKHVRQGVQDLHSWASGLLNASARNHQWPSVAAALEDTLRPDPEADALPSVIPHPAAPSDLQSVQSDVPHANQVAIYNPTENGGSVRFLVNRDLFELLAGETLELATPGECHVQFHRGEMFGNAEHWLPAGTYEFSITEAGWQLSHAPSDDAAR